MRTSSLSVENIALTISKIKVHRAMIDALILWRKLHVVAIVVGKHGIRVLRAPNDGIQIRDVDYFELRGIYHAAFGIARVERRNE